MGSSGLGFGILWDYGVLQGRGFSLGFDNSGLVCLVSAFRRLGVCLGCSIFKLGVDNRG